MSAIALDPGVVEKRPERKGRKERDQGLVRHDAGPDGASVLNGVEDGDDVDPEVRSKRLAKALRWAEAVSEGRHEELLQEHLEAETPKEFLFRLEPFITPRPLISTVLTPEFNEALADKGLEGGTEQSVSNQEVEEDVTPSLDGEAARTGSDAGTDLDVSPRSLVPSMSAHSSRSGSNDGTEQGDEGEAKRYRKTLSILQRGRRATT